MKQFNKDSIPYNVHTLLRNIKGLSLVADATKSSRKAVIRLALSLDKKIRVWRRAEGWKSLANRIKDSERSYLLTGKTTFFSIKHLSGPGITEKCTRVFFTIHRNMFCEPDMSIKTIKSNYKDLKDFLEKYKVEIRDVLNTKFFRFPTRMLKSIRQKNREELLHPKFEMLRVEYPNVDSNYRTGGREYPVRISLSNGPNGCPINSQHADYIALTKDPNLWQAVKNVGALYGYKFQDNYEGKPLSSDRVPIAGRLVGIHDKSCKTRVIAMLDSYTQIVLKPLHRLLMEMLRRIPYDFTFSHDGGVQFLKDINRYMVSVDITAATDTIPADLSFYIIDWILQRGKYRDVTSEEVSLYSQSVRTVMTQRDFYYHNNNKTLCSIRYGRGQPMGAYASFPMLALTNHFLLLLARRLENRRPRYAVVGDDIVICDKKVADRYVKLLEELEIPINLKKTISGFRTFEFCKRIVVDGEIKSSPTLNSFHSSIMNDNPTNLLNSFIERDWEIPRYAVLCKYFSVRTLRTILSKENKIHFPDGPKSVVRIPDKVYRHAERVLTVMELLHKGEDKDPGYDDPFVSRLKYAIEIQKIFTSKFKKLQKKRKLSSDISVMWDLCSVIAANTFYLGYYDTLHNWATLRKKQFFQGDKTTRSQKLRQLCMSQKFKWTSEGLIIDPDLKV